MPASKEQGVEAQFVGFKLADKDYAVDIRRIIEIIYFRPITPMPEAPAFLEGVVDLRGKIIPVIDLRKMLKIKTAENIVPNHILVIRIQKNTVGVIVDNVQQVLRIKLNKLQSPHAVLGEKASRHLKGVYRHEGRLIFILSMENLMSNEETFSLGV